MSLLRIFAIVASMALSQSLFAEVVTVELNYRQGDTEMHGMLAYDDASQEARPGILVVHEWWGQNEYPRERARQLAALGYTALAVDMYGDGKTAAHPDDAGKFARAVGGDLPLAQARFEAALAALREHPTMELRHDTDYLNQEATLTWALEHLKDVLQGSIINYRE